MKKGVNIWRDDMGVPHIDAENLSDMYWGNGYVHATDRGMQMLLMRILGQGRAAELLNSDDETVQVDHFFRRMNWAGNIQEQIEELDTQKKEYLGAYCDGVNAAFAKKSPWELKILGYKTEKWLPENSLMITRMVGYLTLAQSQAEVERLLVEMVQGDISREKLDELFPGILGGLDIELIKKVTVNERIVPSHVLWNNAAPRMMASNNWVVSGKKTASGKPIVANDPHLEVNRLPNVWCEIALTSQGRYIIGGSMPGFPGVLSGRGTDVAWGVTAAFVDSCDSWIEHCKEGKYYREENNQWISFGQRTELIKRKKGEPLEVVFYENDHGVLDGNPYEEGYYLATRWAPGESGAKAVTAILDMWDIKSVDEGMDIMGQVETGWSYVFGDCNGDIGFQMSGRVPKRREGISGFVPLPGWQAENDWQGFLDHKELPRVKNPKEEFFATANNNLNQYGSVGPTNMPMGEYRADRIAHLLAKRDDFTVSDMQEMHFDVYSLQAEYFMEILRPLLPDTSQGDILAKWDMRYDAESEGAYLFELFYKELYLQVFGKNGFGELATDYLKEETGIFIDFYDNFDKVLLSPRSKWFGEESRDEIYRETAARALSAAPRKWKEVQEFTMTHLLFGNKLPRFLGFDRGPVVGIGGRATMHQGQIYRSGGRATTFMPSFRTVTDMYAEEYFSVLAGGPSDRRFSKWYCSELDNWVTGKYKTTVPGLSQQKRPFK
ncbi:MAG: penicillin acylase family protein [Proteobacteria bacterium]|nr:penicillin acylase family protein [Pseudomonadota bacterium]